MIINHSYGILQLCFIVFPVIKLYYLQLHVVNLNSVLKNKQCKYSATGK